MVINVLWNSNLMASKGFIASVEGCCEAVQSGLSLELTVVGTAITDDKMAKNEIDAKLLHYRNLPFFSYLGSVNNERVNTLLCDTDVVLLPSLYKSECQPLALIAAMCSGCEVVVCDTPAIRATLQNYPAHFVHQDPKSIAVALSKVKREDRVSDTDVQIARSRFSEGKFRERFLSLFEMV